MNTQRRRILRPVLTVVILWRISVHCGHHATCSVCTRCSSLCHIDTAQCSIGPVAQTSCTVQVHVTLSVQILQYHGLTASLWLVQWCPLYWDGRIQLTYRYRKLSGRLYYYSFNLKPHNAIRISDNITFLIIISPKYLTSTTNPLLVNSITILFTVLLTSPPHHQIFPQHKILKFQSTIKQLITFKHYTKNISPNKHCRTIKVSELKLILAVYKYNSYYKGRYLVTVAIDKSKFSHIMTPSMQHIPSWKANLF